MGYVTQQQQIPALRRAPRIREFARRWHLFRRKSQPDEARFRMLLLKTRHRIAQHVQPVFHSERDIAEENRRMSSEKSLYFLVEGRRLEIQVLSRERLDGCDFLGTYAVI